jgi:hypothetical protein
MLGWNPIQAGDAFGHGSKVTRWSNDGKTIRVHCIPLIWPLNNVPAECEFDVTCKLVNNTVEIENRLANHRSDHTQHPGRSQELPAIYSNGQWYKLVSYTGNEPFTEAPTTTLVDLNDGKGWPWLTFRGAEHWAALVDKNNYGLGVFEPDVCQFSGGFAGKPKGIGGPMNDQTGYIAPNLDEILDHNIDYGFKYVLILGSVEEIRNYAVKHSDKPHPPVWKFKFSRQHWIYEQTTDAGWPIKGELRVRSGPANAGLLSPQTLWQATAGPVFQMNAAFDAGSVVLLRIQRATTDGARWLGPVKIPIIPDGKFRHYVTNLSSVTDYTGAMARVKIELPATSGTARIRFIGFAGQ